MPVRFPRLRRLTQRALSALEVRGELSLALVDDAQMRALNRQYRRQDRTTDVLAFPQEDCGLIGDVVLSVETIVRRNRTAGRAAPGTRAQSRWQPSPPSLSRRVERDLGRCLIHGILHLTGWDHHTAATRRAMRREERRLWRQAWDDGAFGTA